MLKQWVQRCFFMLTALLLFACGSRVTPENFAKVKKGMTLEETIAILGEPSELNQGDLGIISGAGAVWRNGERTIKITYVNDKVTTKNFIESEDSE